MPGVATTTLPLSVLRRGKVRDVYEVDADRLLVVATDRVSAFDVVMGETVPYKGAVLTQLTAWWLRQLEADRGDARPVGPGGIGRRRIRNEKAGHSEASVVRRRRRRRVYPLDGNRCVVRSGRAGHKSLHR